MILSFYAHVYVFNVDDELGLHKRAVSRGGQNRAKLHQPA